MDLKKKSLEILIKAVALDAKKDEDFKRLCDDEDFKKIVE